MPMLAVKQAVEAHIAAGWSHAPNIPINTTGEPPADGSPWLTVQYPTGRRDHVGMAAIGNRAVRETGTIRFVLAGPRGEGQDMINQWLDELCLLFTLTQFGGVSTYAPSPPIDNDRNDAGPYWVLSSSVEYYFDFFV